MASACVAPVTEPAPAAMPAPSRSGSVRVHTPQISWHARDPVLSIDVSKAGLLATAGNDNEVRLWKLAEPGSADGLATFVQDLTSHSKPVNAVRFSPSGITLASAGDDAIIMLWREKAARPAFGESGGGSGTSWGACCALRGHCSDVYDLCWSPDESGLVSGGVDGTCILWNVPKAKPQQIFRDHDHYIQGVGWDPRDNYVVSVSCDRSARVYAPRPKKGKGGERDFHCVHTLAKQAAKEAPPTSEASRTQRRTGDGAPADGGAEAGGAGGPPADEAAPVDDAPANDAPAEAKAKEEVKEEADAWAASLAALTEEKVKPKEKTERLFLDENVASFFRRPSWSPDGSLLLLPCGIAPGTREAPTTFVFGRGSLGTPAAHLPGPSKPVVAVRSCPVLFELLPTAPPAASSPSGGAAEKRGEAAEAGAADATPALSPGAKPAAAEPSWADLPYRAVWAVASLDSVIVYDSQRSAPLVVASNMHFAALTDLAWLPDGRGLVASSADGYVSFIMFAPGALGTLLPQEKLPPSMRPKPAQDADAPKAEAEVKAEVEVKTEAGVKEEAEASPAAAVAQGDAPAAASSPPVAPPPSSDVPSSADDTRGAAPSAPVGAFGAPQLTTDAFAAASAAAVAQERPQAMPSANTSANSGEEPKKKKRAVLIPL